jgi:hypothetical protein
LRGSDGGVDGSNDGRRDDEDVGIVAVTVVKGVFALSTLDVVVFAIAVSKEDGCTGVRSVASRLTNNALFFSCYTYALNRKLSAQASTTVFQNGGSTCGVCTKLFWGWSRNVGFCLFQISKSGRGVEDIAIDSRASAASEAVIIGGGIIDIVVVGVAGSGIMIGRCRHERGGKG